MLWLQTIYIYSIDRYSTSSTPKWLSLEVDFPKNKFWGSYLEVGFQNDSSLVISVQSLLLFEGEELLPDKIEDLLMDQFLPDLDQNDLKTQGKNNITSSMLQSNRMSVVV